MMPNLPAIDSWGQPVAAGLLGALGAALLVCLRPRIRGTTLIGPWCWSLAALLAVAGCELVIGLRSASSDHWSAALRFAAAASTFCPMMALLGARRPQDRAWALVVASMWVIVALPAAESSLLGRDEFAPVAVVRGWFLWGLIGVGVANMLPTRFGVCAVLLGAAQVCLLAEHLPLLRHSAGGAGVLAALALAALAIVVGWALPVRRSLSPWNRVWVDYRNSFGVLWGLRVAERINAAAEANGWEFSLGWRGFRRNGNVEPDFAPAPHQEAAFQQAMHNLLRRFVSSEWIATRLDKTVH